MKLLGFNFKKISVDKSSDSIENLKINTNIDIYNIETVKTDFIKTKEEVLSVKFTYKIEYSPGIAVVELNGNAVLSTDPKKCKEIINLWKNKKIPEDFKIILFNVIIRKANLKALQLEDEVNLPLHMSMPKVRKSSEQNSQEETNNKKND